MTKLSSNKIVVRKVLAQHGRTNGELVPSGETKNTHYPTILQSLMFVHYPMGRNTRERVLDALNGIVQYGTCAEYTSTLAEDS